LGGSDGMQAVEHEIVAYLRSVQARYPLRQVLCTTGSASLFLGIAWGCLSFIRAHPYLLFVVAGLTLLTTALATFPDGLISCCSEDTQDFFLRTTMAEFAHDDTGTKNFSRRIMRLMMLKDAHTEEDVRHIVEGLNPDFVEAMVRRPMVGWLPELVQCLLLPEPEVKTDQAVADVQMQEEALPEREIVSQIPSAAVLRRNICSQTKTLEERPDSDQVERLRSVRQKMSEMTFSNAWTPKEIADRMFEADRKRVQSYKQPSFSSMIAKLMVRKFQASITAPWANLRWSAPVMTLTTVCCSCGFLMRSPTMQSMLTQGLDCKSLVNDYCSTRQSKLYGFGLVGACLSVTVMNLVRSSAMQDTTQTDTDLM